MDVHHILPDGPVPNDRQLAWHSLEYYGFVHFTVNTFTNREWGRGDESPLIFYPKKFSAIQIADAASSGGMKGLILTAKHHDGFCLWPSDYTKHSVKSSPWLDGKGDVVGALAQACSDKGLKFGIYLSPWDRNHPEYAGPNYIKYYHNQLRELLTRYGPLFEVWFDGANGGDGYYGGKYEKRTIDAHEYYRWDEIFSMVRSHQPDAVIFGGEPGADIRWVGNEGGIAGDPCWHTFESGMGENAGIEALNHGVRTGSVWFPAECDVSIRPGWFYHRRESKKIRDPQNLLDLYFKSVGRGASLLLNLPPDRNGRIPQRDIDSLIGFRDLRDRMFREDIALSAKVTTSSVRYGLKKFSAENIIDGNQNTYWCTEEGVDTPELILTFNEPQKINIISLREYLPLGQRVDAFELYAWQGNGWNIVTSAQAIGNRRILQFPDLTTQQFRLRITKSSASPAIKEFSLFYREV